VLTEAVASIRAHRRGIGRALTAIGLGRRVYGVVVAVLVVLMRLKVGFVVRRAGIWSIGKQEERPRDNCGTSDAEYSMHLDLLPDRGPCTTIACPKIVNVSCTRYFVRNECDGVAYPTKWIGFGFRRGCSLA
jgi:hypothetical protein